MSSAVDRSRANSTPDDLEIHPRNVAYGQEAEPRRWWLGGDPVATGVYNAFSVVIPQGEKFFIDSVKRYRDVVPEAMKPQVDAFIKQEAMHSREHIAFNKYLATHGYDTSRMTKRLESHLKLARAFPGITQVASTAAIEHFTAIFAHAILSDPRHMADADPGPAAMWRWHAMEEIEHKAVAYDTYMAAMKGWGPVLRWLLRSFDMFIETLFFIYEFAATMAGFYQQDRINNFTTWRRALAFMFVKPGMARRVMTHYLAYYRPGFHPWRIDDRHLIAETEAALAKA